MKKLRVEIFRFAALLTLAGGFLDAYTFCCRDGVFANAQTGNIVKVGIAIAEGDMHGVIRYLIPIIAFACGVLLAMLIREKSGSADGVWQRRVLLAEIAVAVAVGLIPSERTLNIAANVMVSFLCALQAESFRKIGGKAFASTMCTGNLRSGSECLYKAVAGGDRAQMKGAAQYFGVIAVFIAGAVLGVWASSALGEAAVLLTVLPLAAAFAALKW